MARLRPNPWDRVGVKARAELDFDFYHATKHFGVHYMWTVLGLSPRAIAAVAGWKSGTVTAMLETYGHADVGAFEEVDAAFAGCKLLNAKPLDQSPSASCCHSRHFVLSFFTAV